MSLLEKFAKLNPNFTFDGAHMKRVKDLEAKHSQMALNRMHLLTRLSQNPNLFNESDRTLFTQGYIDCGYEYETQILQTIFNTEELKWMEQAMTHFKSHLGSHHDMQKGTSIIDRLKMLQKKLENTDG